MKRITIEVSDEFDVPPLYSDQQSDTGGIVLREMALQIGANAVRDVLAVSHSEDHTEILAKYNTTRAELENLRVQLDREAMAKYREVLLTEKEKNAAEREALITRLEQRHSGALAQESQRASSMIADLRTTLQSLRAEHEGLVMKLMARLEPGTSRGTSSASIGRTFEASIQQHLRETFGARAGFQLEDVHSQGHSGDLIMIFDDLRILVELKSYDPKTRIPTKEVEKLARDLTEVQPRCDAAIMISACSEITGHYSYGPLEVSSSVACVPVLFINNFLSLGEPLLTLHMTRVFLAMISPTVATTPLPPVEEDFHRRECARRCTGYLADLNRQSTELLRQVTVMKNSAIKLRETVVSLVEGEVARFTGLVQLMSTTTPQDVEAEESTPPSTYSPKGVFADPATLTPMQRTLVAALCDQYSVGDHQQHCLTKELVASIQTTMQLKSEKQAREVLKTVFLESVIRHGYIVGITKRNHGRGVPSAD